MQRAFVRFLDEIEDFWNSLTFIIKVFELLLLPQGKLDK